MSKRKGNEKDADFTGWRNKDDNNATKKKARTHHAPTSQDGIQSNMWQQFC